MITLLFFKYFSIRLRPRILSALVERLRVSRLRDSLNLFVLFHLEKKIIINIYVGKRGANGMLGRYKVEVSMLEGTTYSRTLPNIKYQLPHTKYGYLVTYPIFLSPKEKDLKTIGRSTVIRNY